MTITPADEPSDIVWENLEIKSTTKHFWKVIIGILYFLILIFVSWIYALLRR